MAKLIKTSFRNVNFLSKGQLRWTSSTSSTQQEAEQTREVQHHARLANDWWNVNGPMRALHALNEIRVPFIRDGLVSRGNIAPAMVQTTRVLEHQSILDVGCGGGVLCEQLARLGATVTGIDLGEDVVEAARAHLNSKSIELKSKIEYQIAPIEVHAKEKCESYDAVIASEVLEHVSDKVAFLQACLLALKPYGSIFITTMNKTLPMWLGGVVLGEYVLGVAPKGTHHWEKFISPLDVQRILDTMNCQTLMVNGSTYDFWRNKWRWVSTKDMCYALQAIKLPAT